MSAVKITISKINKSTVKVFLALKHCGANLIEDQIQKNTNTWQPLHQYPGMPIRSVKTSIHTHHTDLCLFWIFHQIFTYRNYHTDCNYIFLNIIKYKYISFVFFFYYSNNQSEDCISVVCMASLLYNLSCVSKLFYILLFYGGAYSINI